MAAHWCLFRSLAAVVSILLLLHLALPVCSQYAGAKKENRPKEEPRRNVQSSKGYGSYSKSWVPTARFNKKSGGAQRPPPDPFARDRAEEDPAKHAEGRPGAPKLDACSKAALRLCGLDLMQSDFAGFLQCVLDKRNKQPTSDCRAWAEMHVSCMQDIHKLCPRMHPPGTTRCMLRLEAKLSPACSSSTFFASMKEGFSTMEGGQPGGPPSNGDEYADL